MRNNTVYDPIKKHQRNFHFHVWDWGRVHVGGQRVKTSTFQGHRRPLRHMAAWCFFYWIVAKVDTDSWHRRGRNGKQTPFSVYSKVTCHKKSQMLTLWVIYFNLFCLLANYSSASLPLLLFTPRSTAPPSQQIQTNWCLSNTSSESFLFFFFDDVATLKCYSLKKRKESPRVVLSTRLLR